MPSVPVAYIVAAVYISFLISSMSFFQSTLEPTLRYITFLYISTHSTFFRAIFSVTLYAQTKQAAFLDFGSYIFIAFRPDYFLYCQNNCFQMF